MPKMSPPRSFEDLHALCATHPHEAVAWLRILEENGTDLEYLQSNKPAILVDAGSSARDAKLISEGIALLENKRAELEALGSPFGVGRWFNLGNGYYALESARRGPDYAYDPINTPMTRAKECYRNALAEMESKQLLSEDENCATGVDDEEKAHDLRLQTELIINYGNSLDELCRVLEALDRYSEALVLDPAHPVAWWRQGNALFTLAQFVRDPNVLSDSIHALHQALVADRLEEYGYGHYRNEIERNLLKAQQVMDAVGGGGIQHNEHPKPEIPTEYQRDFVAFCTRHRLFLNFSLRERPSPHPYEDKFKFSVVTPIGDSQIFTRLSRILNEATERFAIARLMLFEAYQSPYDTEFHEHVTRYIDVNDAAVYGVRAGKLKLSFEAAYNVLDKIALFLNEYLALDIPKEAVSFDRIWVENRKKPDPVLRQKILDGQNNFVFALYDLARDFGKSSTGEEGEWSYYKRTRHVLTHRYLVLHAFEWDWQIADGDEYHREWDAMVGETTALLYVTRNALLYLMLAVDLEEARRAARQGKKKTVEMPYYLHPPAGGLI